MQRMPKLVVTFVVVLVLVLYCHSLVTPQLPLEDALFLTKNSLKDLRRSYLCKERGFICLWNEEDSTDTGEGEGQAKIIHPGTNRPARWLDSVPGFWGREMDPSFSNVVNSVIPIDSIVSYNRTDTSSTKLVARYASFSPILNGELRSQYAIVAEDGCSKLNNSKYPHYMDKILIIERGSCSFVDKVKNLLGSELRPLAIIVANNEPRSGLITMYSRTFNRDGSLKLPVLFMTNEDYVELREIQDLGISLSIRTASIDSFIGLLVSMALSPPLLILICYLIVRSMQLWGKHRRNSRNQKFVESLPVYIFNGSHLIRSTNFFDYLTATNQTSNIPSLSSSSEDISAGQESDMAPNSSFNGTADMDSMLDNIELLFANKDYYATHKCSICLGRFIPLKSRVLILDCRHVFHEKCLSNWLINFRKTCPLCNESLSALEAQPLSLSESSNYGTFGTDLESNGHDMHQIQSNAAVRSLQIHPVMSLSESTVSQPSYIREYTQGSSFHTAKSTASPNVVSEFMNEERQERFDDARSFVTTRSHMSETSVSIPAPGAGQLEDSAMSNETDAESYESGRSTIRFE